MKQEVRHSGSVTGGHFDRRMLFKQSRDNVSSLSAEISGDRSVYDSTTRHTCFINHIFAVTNGSKLK